MRDAALGWLAASCGARNALFGAGRKAEEVVEIEEMFESIEAVRCAILPFAMVFARACMAGLDMMLAGEMLEGDRTVDPGELVTL
jgi:hypothetical protein